MDETKDTFKTFPSNKKDTITFRPEPSLRAELETLMKKHKFNMTEAIHYVTEQWIALRDAKPSVISPVASVRKEVKEQSEPVATPWDIHCEDLVELPKKGHDCSRKNPPIRVIRPLTPQQCQTCQKREKEDKQAIDLSGKFHLNEKGKKEIAQMMQDLCAQLDEKNKIIQSKDIHIEKWERFWDQESKKIENMTHQLQEWESRETNLSKRESDVETIEREYSSKREELQQLTSMKTQNQDFTTQVKSLSQNLRETHEKCEALENAKKTETAKLEDQIKTLIENPTVLCPDKGSVPLGFCMKNCTNFTICELYPTLYRASQGLHSDLTKRISDERVSTPQNEHALMEKRKMKLFDEEQDLSEDDDIDFDEDEGDYFHDEEAL